MANSFSFYHNRHRAKLAEKHEKVKTKEAMTRKSSSKGNVENKYKNPLDFELKELNSDQDTQMISGLLLDRQLEMFEQRFYLF